MNLHSKILLLIAGLYGAIGVAVAAVGAHALHDMLVSMQRLDTFTKAVDYTTTGALALAAIAALQINAINAKFFFSGYLIAAGTLLFSGSLFIYVLADYRPITAATPWGGVLLIIGWLSLAVVACFHKPKPLR